MNHNEPEPPTPPEPPNPPRYLGRYGKTEWRRVVKHLHDLGLLTEVDRAALEVYCEAYHDWREAKKILDEQGRTYETSTGNFRERPEVKMAREAVKQMKLFMSEFGLTPAARSRLTVPEPQEADPFEELLKRANSS